MAAGLYEKVNLLFDVFTFSCKTKTVDGTTLLFQLFVSLVKRYIFLKNLFKL